MRRQRGIYSVLLLALVGTVSPAPAADVWHGSTIATIYPYDDGSFVITFDVDAPTCTNGNSPKYHLVSAGVNGVNEAGLKNMLAVALAAAAGGHTLSINFNDASTGCPINRLIVNYNL